MKQALFGLFFLLMTSCTYQTALAEHDDYSVAELDRMLAPIALYPDIVLTHILVAATYPLEVVEADRWVKRHDSKGGQAAVDRVAKQDWDPSVKALVAFPELLDRMSADLDWLQDLGEAFLADEGLVLDRVQSLREQAYAAGSFGEMEHLRVHRENRMIYIEPVRERVVYLPYYDPMVVYGGWHWSSYNPVVWRSSHRSTSVGFYWGPRYSLSTNFYFGAIAWPRRSVVFVDVGWTPKHYRARHIARHERSRRWSHDPYHRRHVAYRHHRVHRTYDGYRHESRRSLRRSLEDKGVSTRKKFDRERDYKRDYKREDTRKFSERGSKNNSGERKFSSQRTERHERNHKRPERIYSDGKKNYDRKQLTDNKLHDSKRERQRNFEARMRENAKRSERTEHRSPRQDNKRYQSAERKDAAYKTPRVSAFGGSSERAPRSEKKRSTWSDSGNAAKESKKSSYEYKSSNKDSKRSESKKSNYKRDYSTKRDSSKERRAVRDSGGSKKSFKRENFESRKRLER